MHPNLHQQIELIQSGVKSRNQTCLKQLCYRIELIRQ